MFSCFCSLSSDGRRFFCRSFFGFLHGEDVGEIEVQVRVVNKKDAGGAFALRYLTAESSATEGFDLTKIQGINDFAATLDKLGETAKITASETEAAWAKALSGKDLAVFEAKARAAFWVAVVKRSDWRN